MIAGMGSAPRKARFTSFKQALTRKSQICKDSWDFRMLKSLYILAQNRFHTINLDGQIVKYIFFRQAL